VEEIKLLDHSQNITRNKLKLLEQVRAAIRIAHHFIFIVLKEVIIRLISVIESQYCIKSSNSTGVLE